ncbi:MAG TPA: leucyl aminopeptidase [Polyangiaceae bacterium]|nr:leucyl aminopeptidase [Polyangiaceae bacterium]
MSLNVQISSGAAAAASVDVLALYAFEGDLSKQKHLALVDKALGGGLLSYAKHADFQGKLDQCLEVVTLGKIKPRHVLLVGVGKGKKLENATQRAFAATACRYANGASAKSIALVLPDGADLRSIAEGVGLGAYRFTRYMTGDRVPKAALKDVKLYDAGSSGAVQKKAIALGLSVAEAVCLARDSVNEPPNELYPESLAQMCRKMAKKAKLKIQVFDKKGILSRKMLLHYAVGQGSAHEPRFIHMSYVPKKAKKKLVFVGKGLTFDSGGLCINPAPGMGEMKSDMGGAAAVLGLMAAVGAVRPNVEVHGIIAAAENMPDAAAYRPGDIFGSLSGKTVEIINTDAEGRLVLADALAYASKLKPTAIIDAATLTGACMVALGKTCSAFYTGDADLAKSFDSAASSAGEQFWRMPLLEDLREQLKSDVADLKHTGERWGGSISAALFLREFVTGPWIHCDIAGPVLGDRAKGMYPKGGTGHPVLTFLNFVENAG